MTKRACIIGGTGQIGNAVANALLAQGWDVTLLSRGAREAASAPEGARSVFLDRAVPGALAKGMAGGADAVIDCIAFDREHARQLLEMQADIGAILAISSISVYRDPAGRTLDEARGPETFPLLPMPVAETHATVEPGPKTYSTRKMAMEAELLQGARIPAIILRPGAIHGAFSLHPREWWFVKRMLDGRPKIPLKYQGRSLFSHTSTANIAGLAAHLLAAPKTQVLNSVDADSLTVAQIGNALATALGRNCTVELLDEYAPEPGVGGTPWSTPRPFLASGAAAAEAGFAALPYEAGLPAYCAWMLAASANWRAAFPVIAGYEANAFNYAAEDRFFESLATAR